MGQDDYSFEAVTKTDFPMLHDWLSEPHMQAFWGDADEELALIAEDLDNPVVDMWIVSQDIPFAYVQDYPAHHWPMPHYADFPEGTRAVDAFVGKPDYLNKGHASRFMRQHAEALLAKGYPGVVIDPSPENTAAVRAYRKAGFAGDKIAPCEDGDPVLVLEYRGKPI